MFIGAGIPTICGFGVNGDGVHSKDEYLEIDSIPKILEIYVKTALLI
jgi:acetylornithine deacetylase/succinyl-diaminopimelate desuccinylase-like protein